MKIGILTFHRSINNGAFIQCYSLYKKIKQDFPSCDVEVIDYHMPKVSKLLYPASVFDYYYGSDFKTFAKKTIKLLMNPRKLKEQKRKNKAFEEPLKSLKLSKKRIISNKTDELFEYVNENYDVVVAGSDAIWNYSLRGFPNPYFLSKSISSHKLSYAASCYGMNFENISDQEQAEIKEIIDSYDFIGVRDLETENFAKRLGVSREVVHTCDPTVFLDVDDVPGSDLDMENLLRKHGFDFSKPAIGVMGTDEMCRVFKRVYGERFQIVALFNFCRSADVNLYDVTPFEWARVFRFFSLTVTTYFHGMLLSLKNGTPVICVALKNAFNKCHISKVEDFLARIGMSDCYFDNDFSAANVEKLITKSQELINDRDISIKIAKKMEEEAENYCLFHDVLKKIVDLKKVEVNELKVGSDCAGRKARE